MKKTNLTKEMAIEIRDYLFRQEREIRLVARSVPENEMGKLQKLIDSIGRCREDLNRNCIANPMI